VAKIWKCYQCRDASGRPGVDFIADKPVCPTCRTDGSLPRFAGVVAQCRVIHFEAQHPSLPSAFGIGCGELACGVARRGLMVTGVPDAANCPKCRDTEAWRQAKARREATGDEVELPKAEG
jgi:predicted RNA-binding Zn-ribbon protein involved in translation (DUF1610 family)